jgi:hypothetical protein
VLEHHGWGDAADALAEHARHRRWDALGGEIDDEMLEAFAVVAEPGHLRRALERHADGLMDRLAPYQQFGGAAWRSLTG